MTWWGEWELLAMFATDERQTSSTRDSWRERKKVLRARARCRKKKQRSRTHREQRSTSSRMNAKTTKYTTARDVMSQRAQFMRRRPASPAERKIPWQNHRKGWISFINGIAWNEICLGACSNWMAQSESKNASKKHTRMRRMETIFLRPLFALIFL